MNDDITVRELELVAAILDALYENYLETQLLNRHGENKYIYGYTDAIEVVNNVLDKRGFDLISLIKKNIGRNNGPL